MDLSPEVVERLATDPRVWLATLRPDGSPHVTPVWFVHDPECWWISSQARNAKVRNIRADPRVSLALEDGVQPVIAEGLAQILEGDVAPDLVERFAAKYHQWDVTDQQQGRRVLIKVVQSRWLMSGQAR